jgi:two-component system chemotaxis sensor kinase CheA
MNEFVEQFLLESRELVEQASGDLLALEQTPTDKARVDSAFRAFHTLKGSAAIVDFAAMAKALHAAEDVLAGVRDGEAPITSALISDALACLDQVSQWLDQMQLDGEPPADAEAAADAIVARFAAGAAREPAAAPPADPSWLTGLLARGQRLRDQARSAIRYRPDADCFFRGEDPAALIGALPGLVMLDLDLNGAPEPLDTLDPFSCRLVFHALSTATVEEVGRHAWPRRDQVDIQALGAQASPSVEGAMPAAARALLEAQLGLLAEPGEDGRPARAAAARRVAANVLRYLGRREDADRLEQSASDESLPGAIAAILDAPAGAEAPAVSQPPVASAQAARVLRVDVERVDAMVKLVGELTVLKNALGHVAIRARDGDDPAILAATLKDQHARLERLTDALQQSVLGIRVLPLRHVFMRFSRLVREMAAAAGKSVRLVTEGEATEADKAIVEGLFEPLLHMLRNAVDHGVESAREREAAGKPAAATIKIRGRREGDHVLIDIDDDGRGIDVGRVRRIAAERGIAAQAVILAMSDEEAAELIFAPGFSTASSVTDRSGRGVGMDAVRTSIRRLGGAVTLSNRPGLGLAVRITLPFTVMRTRLVIVEAGGEVFGLPMEAVVETVRAPRDQIAPLGSMRAIVLRERTIPVLDLVEVLGEPRLSPATTDAILVIVETAGQLGGLEVDGVGERIEVMLKPMDGLLAGMPGIAGTTLLGDGRVLLVLDLPALLR